MIILILINLIILNPVYCNNIDDKVKHFFGSMVLSTLITHGTNSKKVGYYCFFVFSSKEFFDDTGFDWGDIIANGLGCLIGGRLG